MKKLYTSVLCMTLLAPIVAQAEICTDFDEDFNIIEFDCAEGVNAARKRIAAESKKAQEQYQAVAEDLRKAEELLKQEREKRGALEAISVEYEKQVAAARAESDKQVKLESERLAEDLRKVEDQLKQEKAKRRALENEKIVSDLAKTGGWKVIAGLGVTGWVGPNVTADAFQGRDVSGWTVYNADYNANGIGFTASLGARYYFNQSNKWFSQISLSVASGYNHEVQINTIEPPQGVISSAPQLSEIKINDFMYIDAIVGRLVLDKTYLYGRFGFGAMDYDMGDYETAYPDFEPYAGACMFGLGLEHNVWQGLFAYAEMNVLVGDFFLGDHFLKFDLGVKYQF